MALVEPILAADRIQGNVLPGFNTSHMHLLGLKLRGEDTAAARAWLAAIQPHVAASSLRALAAERERRREAFAATPRGQRVTPPEPERTWVNVALSFRGLLLLAGLDATRTGEPWFQSGMWLLARALGERPGSVQRWTVGASEAQTPDLLVLLGDENAARLAATLQTIRALAHGLDEIYDDPGDRLEGNAEHFGFRDGISVPAVRGRLSADGDDFLYRRYFVEADPLHDRYARPGQILVWPGQVVFGYPEQSTTDAQEPLVVAHQRPYWMENGSFLTFRRLRQDVGAFQAFVNAQAARARVDAADVAASLVGRRTDGTPLVDPGPRARAVLDGVQERFVNNHFAYRAGTPAVQFRDDAARLVALAPTDGDPNGLACPHSAHIRKVNPRDATTDKGGPAMTLKLQLQRRGIPFGPLPGSGERGLLFMAYSTQIKEPFETLGGHWMNRANAPESAAQGPDLLVGQSPNAMQTTFPGALGTVTAPQGNMWVIPTGGGFFFTPSITLLDALAVGPVA